MSIFSQIAALQSKIDSLSSDDPASISPTMSGAMQRVQEGGYAGPPVDPSAPARFRQLIAEALERGPEYQGSESSYAPVAPAVLNPLIAQNASQYKVDPALIKAVIANESGFNSAATSPVGAQGLMQLMPSTAASLGVQNPYDPAQNIAGGTRYLRGLYDRFGDWHLAVAAYNAGPEAVHRYGGVPPYHETQNYVSSVFNSFRNYANLE